MNSANAGSVLTPRTWVLLTALFVGSLVCRAAELPVYLVYPSFTGDFYATGVLSFPPAAVPSERNILVKVRETGQEVASFVGVLEEWPDGSLLSAEISFPANASRRQNFVVVYGDTVSRRKVIPEKAVLPNVTISAGGIPKTSEGMDVSVGQINVTVDRSPWFRYYGYLPPTLLIVLWTWIRFLRNRRPHED